MPTTMSFVHRLSSSRRAVPAVYLHIVSEKETGGPCTTTLLLLRLLWCLIIMAKLSLLSGENVGWG